jgi:hypothetical protein
MDRKVIDGQVEDRQTGQNKVDERWYLSKPCSVDKRLQRKTRWLCTQSKDWNSAGTSGYVEK